jgi:hypothetical protein
MYELKQIMDVLSSHRDAIVSDREQLTRLVGEIAQKFQEQDAKLVKLEQEICDLILLGKVGR